jgi:16S rRNA (guanine527-N7)-methyltransferase
VSTDPASPPPPTPPQAAAVFGSRLALAESFTELLATSALTHGLVGPREVPKLWERHVLNCAVVQSAVPAGVRLIDVGSGAGLPGLALAIARPDLDVHLVEPMLRRTNWLTDAVSSLGLENVTVHRGRAEDVWGSLSAPVVTARAVARLSELARWCLPLLQPGGTLLALKGMSASEELAADRATLRRLGSVQEEVRSYGAGVLDPETTVIHVRVGERVMPPAGKRGSSRQRKNRRRS